MEKVSPTKSADWLPLLCFQNQFYEENKYAFFKSNIFSLLQNFANSFEDLLKTMQRMHYRKAIIRAKVAL